jgi:hypothetical protein
MSKDKPEKEPTGGKAFDDLLGKLVKVPRKELDAQLKRYRAKRKKRKK